MGGRSGERLLDEVVDKEEEEAVVMVVIVRVGVGLGSGEVDMINDEVIRETIFRTRELSLMMIILNDRCRFMR